MQTVLVAIPTFATIRELGKITDKVSESHAQPLSVAQQLNCNMTGSACCLMKFAPYHERCKTSRFKFSVIAVVVAAVAVPGLTVTPGAMKTLLSYAGTIIRLEETPRAADILAFCWKRGHQVPIAALSPGETA